MTTSLYLSLAAITFVIFTLVDIHRGRAEEWALNLFLGVFWPITLPIIVLVWALVLVCESAGVEPPIKIRKS